MKVTNSHYIGYLRYFLLNVACTTIKRSYYPSIYLHRTYLKNGSFLMTSFWHCVDQRDHQLIGLHYIRLSKLTLVYRKTNYIIPYDTYLLKEVIPDYWIYLPSTNNSTILHSLSGSRTWRNSFRL